MLLTSFSEKFETPLFWATLVCQYGLPRYSKIYQDFRCLALNPSYKFSLGFLSNKKSFFVFDAAFCLNLSQVIQIFYSAWFMPKTYRLIHLFT